MTKQTVKIDGKHGNQTLTTPGLHQVSLKSVTLINLSAET